MENRLDILAANALGYALYSELLTSPAGPPNTARFVFLDPRSAEDFRIRWAAHNVRFHRTGTKKLRHPVVGGLDLTFEAMQLSADPGPD